MSNFGPSKPKAMANTVKRPSKYDEKIKINASFEEVIKLMVSGNPKPKSKGKVAVSMK